MISIFAALNALSNGHHARQLTPESLMWVVLLMLLQVILNIGYVSMRGIAVSEYTPSTSKHTSTI